MAKMNGLERARGVLTPRPPPSPLPSIQFPVSSADVMYHSVSSHNSLLWHTNEAIRLRIIMVLLHSARPNHHVAAQSPYELQLVTLGQASPHAPADPCSFALLAVVGCLGDTHRIPPTPEWPPAKSRIVALQPYGQ